MIDNIIINLDINLSDFQNNVLNDDWDIETKDSVIYSTGEIETVLDKYTIRIDYLKLEYDVGKGQLSIKGSWNKQIKKQNLTPQSIEENMILVDKISSKLGFDISRGKVMMLECGINLLVDNNPENYINIIDQHKDSRIKPSYFKKNETKSFDTTRYSLKFYNKSKEMVKNDYMKYNIPVELEKKNILRYEIRYLNRLKDAFKLTESTKTSKSSGSIFDMKGQDFIFHSGEYLYVSDLYNISFWNRLLLDLESIYFKKILKKPVFNAKEVTTVKKFKDMLANKAICDMKEKDISILIDEDKLKNNQKYNIRNFIKSASSSKYSTSTCLEKELDDKISAEVGRIRNELVEYNDFDSNSNYLF